jgi:hypothetical protein
MRIGAIALAMFILCPMNGLLFAQSRAAIALADDQPETTLRPFVMASGESFAAKETFDAAFGQPVQIFYGGGLEFVSRTGAYLDVTASRLKRTGQRAFRANNQNFGLGIPLTVTVTPVELTAGYRFSRRRPGLPYRATRVIPYLGAGIGSYRYAEHSDFSDAGEDIDMRHTGYLATAGVELRVGRWVGISGAVQYTRVLGILGEGGISKEAGENDLGGVAVRLKFTVGR